MKASERPKETHAAVLRALEVANTALGRAVTIEEIAEALTPGELTLIKRYYAFPLRTAIGSILKLLSVPSEHRGLVYSPGMTIGRRRCFASTRVLRSEEATIPKPTSRREQVVSLVRHAVQEMGRAVRVVDVIAFAENKPEYAHLRPEAIKVALFDSHALGRLSALRVHGQYKHLYLPADLNPEDYTPSDPISWLEWMKAAFQYLWDEHVQEAEYQGRLPRPITTRQVRTRLGEMNCDDPKLLADKGSVVNALWYLARSRTPAVRRISREGRKTLFWCPASVSDTELDIGNAYATDLERIAAAVARAAARHERPVTLHEIEREIDDDPELRLKTCTPVSKAIGWAVKYIDQDGNLKRNGRRNSGVLLSVGRLRGKALYYPRAGTLSRRAATSNSGSWSRSGRN